MFPDEGAENATRSTLIDSKHDKGQIDPYVMRMKVFGRGLGVLKEHILPLVQRYGQRSLLND